MKIKLLATTVVFFLFSAFAIASTTPDDVPSKTAVQHLTAIPDILYFNQDYTLDLTETKGLSVSTLIIDDLHVDATGNAIHFFIPWSNRENAERTIKVYSGSGADAKLIMSKTVAVIQKVKGNVASNTDLFKLDDKLISQEENILPEDFLKYQKLEVNPDRFNAPGLRVKGFIIRIPSVDGLIYNEGSAITDATKAAISKLRIGDVIIIDKIKCSYKEGVESIPLDINYALSITLSPEYVNYKLLSP